MAVIDIELPLLLFVAALGCAAAVWLLGTWIPSLRGFRYRSTFGILAFALSGLLGFLAVVKLEMSYFGDWFSTRPVSVSLGFAYLGGLLFGLLGCWNGLRIGGRMDRKHTLTMLYSLVESRKKQDAH